MEKLEAERLCGVEVRYLLVVPQEIAETSEVVWDMATEACSSAPGEVFVQSLGMHDEDWYIESRRIGR